MVSIWNWSMIYEVQVRVGTRVWVRVWDLAIFEKVGCRCGRTQRLKNYKKYFYLYFLYIFTIKILLKNTLLSLIHKTKKKEGKIHSEMRISTVPARFKADFGLFRSLADTDWYGQYDPILVESAWFDANRSRIGANQVESAQIPKKKHSDAAPTRGHQHRTPHRAASDSGAAPSQPRLYFPVYDSN